MTVLNDAALRDAGLAFWGQVISVQTHEVTNAFSVINEMAGLQWDILRDAASGESVDLYELESICDKIRGHVRRGDAVVRSINWIAHSVDHLRGPIEVNDALTKIALVAESWLRRRRAVVDLRLPPASTTIEARPFFFVFSVLLGIDVVTGKMGEKTIAVDGHFQDECLALSIANLNELTLAETDNRKIETLSSLLTAMGGRFRLSTNAKGASIERVDLRIPKRSAGVDAER